MKIREMIVGKAITTELVLANCNLRKTGAGKPYLDANFTDGIDTINCKLWNYTSENAPATNVIYVIDAVVGDYQGNKQLTIGSMVICADQDQSKFNKTFVDAPTTLWNHLMDRIAAIKNNKIREIVFAVYKTYQEELFKATSAKGIHHCGMYGNVAHTIETCDIAVMLAEYANLKNYYDLPVSVDLAAGGALIHDIGKARTYDVNGAVISYTKAGYLADHIVLGLSMLYDIQSQFDDSYDGVFELLAHIITSHHGQVEYGSPTTPGFAEAHIVNIADGASASIDTLLSANKKAMDEGKPMTDRLFTLGNKEHFLQNWVADILK